MPDDLQAHAPDGTIHSFPAGTDPAVVDRVMKQYITGLQSQPQVQDVPARGTISEMGPGSYQTRKGGPILQEGESPLRTGALAAESALGATRAPTSGWDLAGQAAKAAGSAGLSALKDPLNIGKGIDQFATSIGGAAKDIGRGMGYRPGDMLTPSGPTDMNSVAAGLGSVFGMKGQTVGPQAVTETVFKLGRESVNLVRTADAITNGMTKLAKEQVRPVLNAAENAWHTEVGRHAQAVIEADEARAQRGARINVNANVAAEAADAKVTAMRGYVPSEQVVGFISDARQPMSLANAKALATDLGRSIGAAMRKGLTQDAAVMEELYSKLHETTQEHANGLGREYGNSWKQYIDVHAAHMERLKGIYGDLQDGFAGPDVMNKLVNPEKANEFHQLVKDMKAYKVDTKPLESARQYGYSLQDTLQKNSNLFFGKMRAIIRYPWAAGPVAIGAGEIGKLSHLPGMSFVLPLIAAGKVAGLLDMRQLRILLNDIQKGKIVPGTEAPKGLTSPFERDMPSQRGLPPSGAAPNPTVPNTPAAKPGGGGFKGGINVRGVEASTGARAPEADVQSHSSEINRLKAIRDSGVATDEERQIADEQLANHEQMRAQLINKLRSRRPSGVYSGSR